MRGRLTLPRATAALALLAAASAAAAQSAPRVSVGLPPATAGANGGPSVVIEDAFRDRRSMELLEGAFPAIISTTVELWQDRGWFDRLLDTERWQRIVRFDVLSKTYVAARINAGIEGRRDSLVPEGRFATLEEVRTWLAQPRKATHVAPRDMRQLYYAVTVTIEILNSNDLVEVQRWLQGEVQPAMRGEQNPGSALARTFRTLFARLLGGDTKRLRKTSERFNTL